MKVSDLFFSSLITSEKRGIRASSLTKGLKSESWKIENEITNVGHFEDSDCLVEFTLFY